MSHPLFWPGKYYFYPIGNTPAVCLTRDLAPEEPANMLLLGCGDPRNVLYTIFSEPQIGIYLNVFDISSCSNWLWYPTACRTLDFSCIDMDPAVLARNVLLLTMIADNKPYTTTTWNIFFHLYLDKDSCSVLIEQCRKLIGLSENLQRWNTSLYGPFIKMSTEYTLTELRRHWILYIEMQDLPLERLDAIRDTFVKQSSTTSEKHPVNLTSTRSAGPLYMKAIEVAAGHFRHYCKTGVTFSDHTQIAAATLLNPTFVYSLGGEGCNVHYGIDVLNLFHLADLFANAKQPVSVEDAVNTATAEFSDWCSAFHTSIFPANFTIPVIRFFVGEATAVCRALQAFDTSGTLNLGLPVMRWRAQLIVLNKDQYVSGGAPCNFNVIDTSNLDDHIGVLNILIATVPLLSKFPRSGVLYTESLLFRSQNATKDFAERLYADITIIGLLLGVCPVDYISGFTTRSNTHELLMYNVLKKDIAQFHQVTTWKPPTSGDVMAVRTQAECRPPDFNPCQLGTLLYDMYHQLFKQEDATHLSNLNRRDKLRAISNSNLVHYIRESFVLLLRLVRDRMCVSEDRWPEVMRRFYDLREANQSFETDSLNYHDLWAQLHRHGVYTVPIYHTKLRKAGIFSNWDTVPPLIRVILIVPREKLAVLEWSAEEGCNPLLQCDVRDGVRHNVFTAVDVAFGKVISMGTKTHPSVIFDEDTEGLYGTSSLIASFAMSAGLLIYSERVEDLRICFSVQVTLGTVHVFNKLGMEPTIFTAKLTDETHVHVLPERPLHSKENQISSPIIHSAPGLLAQIGESGAITAELDEECELVDSLTCRVAVENEEVKGLFSSGAAPQVVQVSPCVIKITIGSRSQEIMYPFPIIGSRHRLRVARKSLYIEVVVPVSGPLDPDGMKLSLFPVIGTDRILSPWNVHHLNLSRLPILRSDAIQLNTWLDPHIGSMMSSRERSLRKKHDNDAIMLVKDTLHMIIARSSGISGGPARRVFALLDKATQNSDTIFFISDLRFDLPSHTIVCDGYVLLLNDQLMPKIRSPFSKLVASGSMVHVHTYEGEMKAWKQFLPALVERCRSSWKHENNCEYETHGRVPLTVSEDMDPLCSCGKGKDVEGMAKVGLWSEFAPYVTRLPLSPLFAVSYLETVVRDRKCSVCRGKGKPKLMTCTKCKAVQYCGRECQRRDWKFHKTQCS